MIAGMLINRLGGFLQVFLVLYLIERGNSAGQAGAALGANGVGAIAGVLAGGWLTARFGARTTIVASMTATAVLTAALPYVGGYVFVVVVVALVGVTSQVYRPASAEVISRLIPEERQVMVFAMYRLATNIGTAAAPLIGIALVAISYEVLFWGEAVAALGCALVVLIALRDMADGHGSSGREQITGPRSGYLALIRDGRFLVFLFGILGYATVYSQYLSTLPLTVRANGMHEAVYGVLVSTNAVIVIACELLVTRYVQRWHTRVAVFVGAVLVGLGVAMYALPAGVAVFVVATVIWSLGETVSAPSLVAYPARAQPSAELRSRYLGSSQAAYGIGSAAGPAAGPALWSGIGDAVWLVNGAVAMVAAAAAAAGVRRHR
ncbi:MFS transporter [Actinophytocola glycyrrhizae]|uniref:MFS transporter n=1 Tax=Actinophytocola glycyrrhizae TaxID=2044873 RepID=A0ABV9SBU9_9PSEU